MVNAEQEQTTLPPMAGQSDRSIHILEGDGLEDLRAPERPGAGTLVIYLSWLGCPHNQDINGRKLWKWPREYQFPAPETLDLHGLDRTDVHAELSAKALKPEWEKVANVGRVTRASKIPSSSGSESGEQNLSDADAARTCHNHVIILKCS